MKEEIVELLLKDTLGNVEQGVKDKLEAVETSFEAQLDGLRTRLNSKINDITAVVEQRPLVVNFGTVEAPKSELVHSQFTTVVNTLKSQKRNPKNIMLVGEAGSGKTHLASSVAKALGLKFYPMSVGLQTTKSDLLGFINAHGNYVTSPVREAFENGGVLLLDEFDAAHAGVVTIINSLLANGHCSFPDKIVEKNDKFICMVACNTYGHGANIDYVGRNRLDGATLDRFVVIHVGYDDTLEKQLTCNNHWFNIVKQIRKNIEKQGIKMIVSPRASMNGADLLDAGFSIDNVLEMVILKGADNDTRSKLLQGIDLAEYEHSEHKEPVGSVIPTNELKEKYQVFEVRTENEDINSRITVMKCLNSKIEGMGHRVQIGDFKCMFGTDWVWQFSAYDEMYFQSKTVGSECSMCGQREDYLHDFFKYIDKNGGTVTDELNVGVAFQFAKKGCKVPYKTIILERV